MPRQVVEYTLLISCPGDIKSEIGLIQEAVEEFNALYTETIGITIRTKHWSKNAFAESGDKPQNLLNKQIVFGCDAAVAVFWSRFGTPTDEFKSGTEEEIEHMLKSGKQVFMYFSDVPMSLSMQNPEQYEKVKRFKEKYRNKGLYFEYSSTEVFRKLFYAHLSQYFLSLKKIDELQFSNKPILKLKSLDKDIPEEKLTIHKFSSSKYLKSEDIKCKIEDLYLKINSYGIHEVKVSNNLYSLSLDEPVIIADDKKDIIVHFADLDNIKLNDNFFALGELHTNKLDSINNVISGAGPSLRGSALEKEKHWDLMRLYDLIGLYTDWFPFEEIMSEYYCIRLVISNEGTLFDEDVDVLIEFDKGSVIPHNKLPVPQECGLKRISSEDAVNLIFGIPSTIYYEDYWTNNNHEVNVVTPNIPYFHVDRVKEYRNRINAEFVYQYYSTSENDVLKIHFNYIKHNTSIAFPTVIFVDKDLNKISYKIKSKNCHSEYKAELEV